MPELKLADLVAAVQPERLLPVLAPFFEGAAEAPVLDATRLEPPQYYWAVYKSGDRHVTLKAFFAAADYAQYTEKLLEYYPNRVDHPEHPRGGFVLLPEWNSIVWGFPFDPAMPELYRCVDGAWVAKVLRRSSPEPLQVRTLRYNPELGALLAYRVRRGRQSRLIAIGKVEPRATSGRIFLVMNRLWVVAEQSRGQLRVARPLAFRPEAGLLVQAAVPGKPLRTDRNRTIFLDLVQQAGPALATLHAADIPFGPQRSIRNLVTRLKNGLPDLALTSPPLHGALSLLVRQIEAREAGTQPGLPVPSHGDFKYDQFLEFRRRYSFIDFETFCLAEPAYDVGFFCAYLPPTSPSDWRESAAAEMLRSAFLHSYATASGAPLDLARIGVHEAATLGIRALAHAWRFESGWQSRASQLFALAMERLVNPEPASLSFTD